MNDPLSRPHDREGSSEAGTSAKVADPSPPPATFLVWGAGGHGKVIADLVRACGGHVAGFVDADPAKLGQTFAGERVLARQKDLVERLRQGRGYPGGVDAVALAVGDNSARQVALESLQGHRVPALVHPAAVVSPSATVGEGTVVLARVVINADARVGRAVIVNSSAVVEHDCVVGDGVHISPGAVVSGGVRIGERSWIGAGATVIQGIAIGADVTVGAGAVVIRDVPDGRTVVGVPARPTGER